MSSNAVESGWQRLRGWMNRQWRRSVDPISARASGTAEGREIRSTEQVQAWEDEGGAPASAQRLEQHADGQQLGR